MSFATLALIGLVALAGPLLATPRAWRIPVVFGELAAGVVVGRTGFDAVHADNPTFTFLADVGFALVMFVAGSHVPLRDATLRTALVAGAVRAVAVGGLAAAAGFGIASAFDTSHAALYAVVLASSSAALVLPIVDSLGLTGPSVLQLLVQVAVADTVCIVALPLVIEPNRAGRAAAGSVAVIAAALVVYLVLRAYQQRGGQSRVKRLSKRRQFALELRIDLTILFALAAVAVETHVSILLAGFSFGLVIAALGEPHRLARQLFAVTDGFLAPLFFVWLGASINLRALGHTPKDILLGIALGAAALAVHGLMRVAGQPLPLAALAAAQLGVPIAAATIGTQSNLLNQGEAAALILGALVTVAAATAGGAVAARRRATTDGPAAKVAPPARTKTPTPVVDTGEALTTLDEGATQ